MNNLKTKDITLMALFVVIIELCAYITIPTTVPFTLQTFGVFMALLLLGGKKAFLSILSNILLFRLSSIFTLTGGYIIGFLGIAVIYMLFERICKSKITTFLVLCLGNVICYTFGTLWFVHMYTQSIDTISYMSALAICVLPFIIPDILKIVLALIIAKRLKKHIY